MRLTELPAPYRALLTRYRYGPGTLKLDWALDGPIPWRDDRCDTAAREGRSQRVFFLRRLVAGRRSHLGQDVGYSSDLARGLGQP